MPVAKYGGDSIENWLAETTSVLAEVRSRGWTQFADAYGQVLAAAGERLEIIDSRLRALIGRSTTLNQDEFLSQYVGAMSVRVDSRDYFLPSFSDQCLWQIVRGHPDELSPFRGLHYAWRLSEIAGQFQRPRRNEAAFRDLEDLADQLGHDQRCQTGMTYHRYETSLREHPNRWNRQIKDVKAAVRDVAAPLKWRWIHVFPYPCVTASHFYLSGIRYYHNAHIQGGEEFPAQDRYGVHSTDSGLTLPIERYGMLLPDDADTDIANELITELPVGSLLLDLSAAEATQSDRHQLRYFENWSRLVTAKAYAIVTEALTLHSYAKPRGSPHRATLYKKMARTTFLTAVAKNPMRAFYFDTGLYGAALLAMTSGLPKVQYVTTRRSAVGRTKTDPGRRMLSEFLDRVGDATELYVTNGLDWPIAEMATWTLVPIGRRIPQQTSCLWSLRSPKSRKIARGLEGLRRHAYLRGVLEPGELVREALEAAVGAAVGGAIVPGQILAGIGIGGLVGTTASTARIRQRVTTAVDAMTHVPTSREYTRVRSIRDLSTT